MKLYHTTIVLLALMTAPFLSAQESGLQGSLYDQENKSIPFATVALIELPDSTLVTGTTTEMDGSFLMDARDEGTFALRFSAIGFETTYTKPFQATRPDFNKNFGKIIIQEEMTMLNEVMVEAWRPRVELEAGKIVVRVENRAMTTGSSAFEIVSKSPGVTVDQDGEISLNGQKGIQIIINGRETYLSSEEVKNMLESMPAENIESIELIHSPSAKYSAAGKAGIINIVLKENVTLGFSGSIYGSAEFNNENWYNAGANLNYGNQKWNFFLSADVNKSGFNRKQEVERLFTTEREYDYYQQSGKQLDVRWTPSFRAGVDYEINDRHTVGITGNFSFFNEDGYWNTETDLGTFSEGDQVNIVARNSSEEAYQNGRFNAHYIGKLDTLGTTVSADLDYVRLNRDRDSYFENDYTYLMENREENENLFNRSISFYDIFAAKADVTLPLNDESNLSLGVKGSKVVSNSDLKFFVEQDGRNVLDSSRTNDFRYEEEIYAAYLSYSNQLDETWDLQLGLRAEKTLGEGISPTTGDINKKDYLNLFPNIQVGQKVSDQYEIGYSFNRRIERPRYSTLNPFLFYLDPYTYIVGNPDLDAAITSSYKVTQSLMEKYQLILGYDYTKGPMGEYPRTDEETGHTVFTTANHDKSTSLFATLVVPVEFGSFWSMTNTFVANQMRYKISYENKLIKNNKLFYSIQSRNQLALPWEVKMELTGVFHGPMAIGIYQIDSRWYVDLGLKKSFLQDRLEVTLKATDVLDGMHMEVSGEYPGSTFLMNQHFFSRGVSVGLRYKLKGAGKEQKLPQDSLEELNRAGG